MPAGALKAITFKVVLHRQRATASAERFGCDSFTSAPCRNLLIVSGSSSSQRDAFAARLAKAPLLLDGAMGTLLYSRGVPQRASLDELVETRPDLIGAIHREYIEAGADAIETHSFGASRLRLAPFGLAGKAALFNRRAAQIAREARDVAGKRDVLVAGSIGPLEAPLHGPDARLEQRIRDAFKEQIEGLLEGGVDFLLFE